MTRSFLSYLLALVFYCVLGLLAITSTSKADDASAFARLATENYGDIETGIGAVAATGSPQAESVLAALGESKLFYRPSDKALFYKDMSGALIDALTGKAALETPQGLKPVKVNNRVRRALEAALGSMTLLASDPQKRMAAADAVFKSRDSAALPALEQALAKETDAQVKHHFADARAAVVIGKSDASEADRVAAAETLGARGDQEALALVSAVTPDNAPSSVASAASIAAKAITRKLALLATAQNAWYGLSLGSVLLLAAIGLAITFGVMGIINMAHGEMVMLGAYTTFVVQEILRVNAPAYFDWSLPIAIPLAFLVSGFTGLVIERLIIRHLYGRPLETLLATWGVSLFLQQMVRSVFGANNREVGAPSYMAGVLDLNGFHITYGRFWIIVFSLTVFAALLLVMRGTSLGLTMRAVIQNRRMAASMGIRTPLVDAMTFALGSGVAGIAGVALSQIDNVSPNLGQSYIVDSFLVVVFGGVGNLWGTLLGALSLGLANKFLEPVAGAVLGKIVLLAAIILFIQRRPRGLFALKGRAVEQ
jgi:urea transport system permease protein